MQLARHHRLALLGVVGLGSIALFDALTHGLTGHYSDFSDETARPWLATAGGVVHGLAYLGMIWVLLAERSRLRVGRLTGLLWWVLVASFAAFAAVHLADLPMAAFGGFEAYRELVDAIEVVITAAFIGHFLGAVAFGFALIRHPETGPGSRVLLAILPILGITMLIAWLAPDWAHPAYLEVTTLLGIALLGAAERPPVSAPGHPGRELAAEQEQR